MDESILRSIKKLVGIDPDQTAFDMDILIHINSVFGILNQLGVGPEVPFMITGEDETWSDFISGPFDLMTVKSYIYLRVRMLFDPPSNSFLADVIDRQIKEFEWRMNIEAEGGSEDGSSRRTVSPWSFGHEMGDS